MKKLLGILVLGLLWCNTSFAESIDDFLSRKGLDGHGHKEDVGLENEFYNHIADDWFKYMVESSHSAIMDYCESISAKQPAGLIQIADCMYKEDVRIIRKHDFDYDNQMKLLYSTYQTYRNIMVVAAVSARYDVRSRSESQQIIFNALVNLNTVWLNSKVQQYELFHRFAEAEVKKAFAEPEGPKIDDKKVVAAASGTGFFVSKAGHIVTNHHVTENCNQVKVIFKGTEVEAKIFAVDKRNDLAIIEANINPDKVYAVSNKDVSLLQDVIVAGFPLGKDISSAIKIHKGSVTALAGFGDNYSNFETDATINQGNSGGPIVDHKGNIVGVAVATWVEEGVQNIYFGIKASTLKTFANANEITFLPPSNQEMSNEELGRLFTDATVFLECWMTGAKIKELIAQKNNRKAFYSKFK